MQHITIISFTKIGSQLNQVLNRKLSKIGYLCDSYAISNYAKEFGLQVLPSNTQSWIGMEWGHTSFVFIGTTGMAIRCISSWLKDKYTDSAVVTVDEKGTFIIPLIEGHIEGATMLAKEIAKAIDGIPIITSTFDAKGKFTIDVFAKDHGLEVTNDKLANCISAALLDGVPIGLYSEYPLKETFPQEIVVVACEKELEKYEFGVTIKDQIDLTVSELSESILHLPTIKGKAVS